VAEDSYNPHVEVVEYRRWRLTLRETPLDWLVFIALPGGHPLVVGGVDRDDALAKARAWVDENTSTPDEQL
jgi:hypothetical protein